jgi:hypothetical protein
MWPTGFRPGGAAMRGVPGREAATHLIPDEGGVLSETVLEASA